MKEVRFNTGYLGVSDEIYLTDVYNNKDLTIIPLKEFTSRQALNRPENTTEHLFYMIGFLILFAFIRLRGKNLFATWTSAFFVWGKAEIIQNDGISQHLIYYLFALLLSFSSIAVGVCFYLQEFNLRMMYYLLSGFFAWHFFSLIVIKTTGWTFNVKSLANEAIVNVWVFNIMSGLFISPFVFVLLFVRPQAMESVINISLIALILIYIIKLFHWFQIFLINKVSSFYMILYICTLEIYPLFMLYRLLG